MLINIGLCKTIQKSLSKIYFFCNSSLMWFQRFKNKNNILAGSLTLVNYFVQIKKRNINKILNLPYIF